MLKKRLVGVVTVKNGWAVQSFGFRRYLPLGRPECLVENLDRWGADEILVQCIDRSTQNAGPDFALLDKLARRGLGTPLIYGGGIASVEDGVRAIQAGADRIAIDGILHDDLSVVAELGHQLGVQALIATLPLRATDDSLLWRDYRDGTDAPIRSLAPVLDQGLVSELLVIDHDHEGEDGGFDPRLLAALPSGNTPLLAFGGISRVPQILDLLAQKHVAAVCIGNFLSYHELAIQQFRRALVCPDLRPAVYASNPARSKP